MYYNKCILTVMHSLIVGSHIWLNQLFEMNGVIHARVDLDLCCFFTSEIGLQKIQTVSLKRYDIYLLVLQNILPFILSVSVYLIGGIIEEKWVVWKKKWIYHIMCVDHMELFPSLCLEPGLPLTISFLEWVVLLFWFILIHGWCTNIYTNDYTSIYKRCHRFL
jgi:hypothetical protein